MYLVRIPAGSDVYHRGRAYAVFQIVQRPGVCGVGYGPEHYEEQLRSFDNMDESRA